MVAKNDVDVECEGKLNGERSVAHTIQIKLHVSERRCRMHFEPCALIHRILSKRAKIEIHWNRI